MKVRIIISASILSLSLAMPLGRVFATTTITEDQILYTTNNSGIDVVNSDGTDHSTFVSSTSIPDAASPQISPDRTKVYYSGTVSSHMYVINADGTGNTDLGYTSGVFALSPDGTKIATVGASYQSPIDHNYYSPLRIQNVDGTGMTDVHPSIPGSVNGQVAWTNDGNSVIFEFRQMNASNAWDNCYIRLAKMNTDGTGFTFLTPDNTGNPSNSCAALAPENPAVDPVNGKIAYDNRDGWLYTMNSDGTGSSLLYSAGSGRASGKPTWSPDGNSIAIDYQTSTGTTHYVGVISASTGSLLASGGAITGNIDYLDWSS